MATQNLPALAESHIKTVREQILKLQENKELDLPADYSSGNALRSAYLILQDTTDMSGRPALEVCTEASITQALMKMVTQGLNPAKDQGYFIVYGKKLVFLRSYFGSEALAKRVDPSIKDIEAEPVYVGDTLEYEIVSGKKRITAHKQTLDSVEGSKIKAAYAMTIDHQGEITKTTIMTIDEIKAAWRQSKTRPVTDDDKIRKGSAHEKFTGQMARRTVINRMCKEIINSSSDKSLLKKAIVDAEQDIAEAVFDAQIAENANQTPVDIDTETGEVADAECAEDGTPQPPPEKSEPQKDTPAPTEDKESPEPQGEPEFEETESPIDTALRTGKEEKEQKQKQIRTKPKYVERLCDYLNKIQPSMLEGAMDRLKEESFGELCEKDQAKIIAYCDKLIIQRDERDSRQDPEF